MAVATTPVPRPRYEFLVRGALSERALAAFPELAHGSAPAECTRLTGPVDGDQGLRALLARFDVLGLTVIEMRRLSE
ncbi:hypothetical protein [Rhodococcus triatomae]|nr:hypothetical protein G419_16465 [Rhodococcus triatomae BKS 15-14]